jgi:hypothetical protein
VLVRSALARRQWHPAYSSFHLQPLAATSGQRAFSLVAEFFHHQGTKDTTKSDKPIQATAFFVIFVSSWFIASSSP